MCDMTNLAARGIRQCRVVPGSRGVHELHSECAR